MNIDELERCSNQWFTLLVILCVARQLQSVTAEHEVVQCSDAVPSQVQVCLGPFHDRLKEQSTNTEAEQTYLLDFLQGYKAFIG